MSTENKTEQEIERERLEKLAIQNFDRSREDKREAYKSMNNIIFIVSSGSLVLSITLLSYLSIQMHYEWMLVSSWVFLFLAIIANFIAHWITAKYSEEELDLINIWVHSHYDIKENPDKKRSDNKNMKKYIKYAKWVNPLVLFFLGMGIIFIIVFAAINTGVKSQKNYEKDVEEKAMSELVKDNLRLELTIKQERLEN